MYIVKQEEEFYTAETKVDAQKKCCALILKHILEGNLLVGKPARSKIVCKDITDLIRSNKFLDAIKIYRTNTGNSINYYQAKDEDGLTVEQQLTNIDVQDIIK